MSDDQILYGSSILCLILVFISFKFSRFFAVTNLIVLLGYSAIMYYGLFYKSESGAALGWWFYLVSLTAIQIVVIGIYLLLQINKKNN